MKPISFIIACIILCITSSVNAEDSMTLRGQGEVRYLGMIKVYDAKLFTPEETRDSNVLDADVSRCLRLTYAVALDPDDFVAGAEHVLNKQYQGTQLSADLTNHIDTLHRQYQPVKKGDSYNLCYDARTEITTLHLNDRKLVEIQSPEFAGVYFGIWLGKGEVLDQSLRDQLLSETPLG